MEDTNPCKSSILPIRDTLDVVGGKWKLPIIHKLLYHEKRRFKELQRDLEGITSRMLSAELKQLEQNDLVKREVFNTAPPTVVYSLSEYGHSLKYVISALYNWGTQHRKRILQGSEDIILNFNEMDKTCEETAIRNRFPQEKALVEG